MYALIHTGSLKLLKFALFLLGFYIITNGLASYVPTQYYVSVSRDFPSELQRSQGWVYVSESDELYTTVPPPPLSSASCDAFIRPIIIQLCFFALCQKTMNQCPLMSLSFPSPSPLLLRFQFSRPGISPGHPFTST